MRMPPEPSALRNSPRLFISINVFRTCRLSPKTSLFVHSLSGDPNCLSRCNGTAIVSARTRLFGVLAAYSSSYSLAWRNSSGRRYSSKYSPALRRAASASPCPSVSRCVIEPSDTEVAYLRHLSPRPAEEPGEGAPSYGYRNRLRTRPTRPGRQAVPPASPQAPQPCRSSHSEHLRRLGVAAGWRAG